MNKNTLISIMMAVLAFVQTGCGEVSRPTYIPSAYSAVQKSEGIAVAIIYDTSGSMIDTVQNAKGRSESKYLIANRALASLTGKIEYFVKVNPMKRVEACLLTFNVNQLVDLGPFDPAPFRSFASSFNDPRGSTPLGSAIKVASNVLLKSALAHRHIIVITDGENTEGANPESVFPEVKAQGVALHLIAFDASANIFEAIKKEGATVVGASNEEQLQAQLTNILQKEVLLEDAE